jgi:hypothetical protein
VARFRQTIEEVTLLSAWKGATTAYVWDAPVSIPIKNVNIIISSEGREHWAGDLEWEVFLVHKWDGTPFDSSATPTPGVSKGSGILVHPQELYETVYTYDKILPANRRINKTPTGPIDLSGLGGAAIVLKLTNVDIGSTGAENIHLVVIFESEEVGDAY